MPIEEENSAERLVLRGGGDLLLSCEVREKSLNFGCTHLSRMPLLVEEDITLDPFLVRLFGAEGVMFQANGIADLIEDFLARRRL